MSKKSIPVPVPARYAISVLLPALAAIASAVAAFAEGAARSYGIWGSAICAVGIACWGVLREVWAKREEADALARVKRAKHEVLGAAIPLVKELGKLAVVSADGAGRVPVQVLRNRVVAAARTQCGTDDRENYRAALYLWRDGHLTLADHEGRDGGRAPRAVFLPDGEYERFVLRHARGSDPLFYEDLLEKAPESFGSVSPRSFRSLISVPVHVSGRSFGMLSVDSPEPGSLTPVDRDHMILLAAVLAAGLAAEERDGESLKEAS
ncbi:MULTISPECIES: GAF domain-containing protein [Actinosynnema]|uniref:GAF domain-containing protein n=1 Tax=Actinosynnema pretiosum TaxID=42197 RepID=A0A290ZD65_9PSEU|nr:GAF domain-containing protein [Actinosynnema pretiosum]ATE56971.1 hypothetical protein CNX65_29825 [Actinosynnema pretiosum]